MTIAILLPILAFLTLQHYLIASLTAGPVTLNTGQSIDGGVSPWTCPPLAGSARDDRKTLTPSPATEHGELQGFTRPNRVPDSCAG